MEETAPFGSTAYLVTLSLLVFARGMDLLSTRIATPNLVLEANPIARRLGWTWGGLFNLLFAGLLACWPVPALVVVTTSLMVAGRNFKSAWLMRSLGEEGYQGLIVGV